MGIDRLAQATSEAGQPSHRRVSTAALSWSAPVRVDPGGHEQDSVPVACPLTQCTAVDLDGNEVAFDATAPGNPTPRRSRRWIHKSETCRKRTSDFLVPAKTRPVHVWVVTTAWGGRVTKVPITTD